MRATGSRSDAMGPFFGGHDGHERCLEVAYTVPSSEPHSRPKPWPGAAAAAPTPACLRSTDRTLWGSAMPSGASRELDHRPRTQPAPICRQESKGAAFVPRVGCSNRPGGRRRPDSSERRIDRDKARRRASASVRLRVFYWLVRGIFVSRRELSNKVTWGFWGRKMEFSGRRARS